MSMLRCARTFVFMVLAGILLAGCSQSANTQTAESETTAPAAEVTTPAGPNWEDFVSAAVNEFSVSKQECSYDDGTLELLITLTNISDRDIAAIQAGVSVTDLFGEEINSYNISSDEPLPVGRSVKVGSWGSTCYGLNEISSDDARLLAMSNVAEQTKLEVEVSKIAFTDGEILEF